MTPNQHRCAALVAFVGLLGVAALPVPQAIQQRPAESCNELLAQGLPGVGQKTARVAMLAVQTGQLQDLPASARPYAQEWFAYPTELAESAQAVRGDTHDRGNEHRIDGSDRSPTRPRGDQP